MADRQRLSKWAALLLGRVAETSLALTDCGGRPQPDAWSHKVRIDAYDNAMKNLREYIAMLEKRRPRPGEISNG